MSMKILACFKILPNPDRVLEEDWEQFSSTLDLAYAGIDFNCFDQSALELSLRIREQMAVQGADVTCTALTVSETVPAALAANLYAAGFDEVVCIPQKNREFRPAQIADLLAAEIGRQGADLVFAGAQAGMAETGLVPYLLAQHLGYPLVSGAETAVWQENLLHIQCREPAGLMEYQAELPLVCAVGNSPLVLRCATLRARIKVQGKQAQVLADVPQLAAMSEPNLTRPHAGRECRMLDPKSQESAQEFLNELKKAGGEEQQPLLQQFPEQWIEVLKENTLVVQPGSLFGLDFQQMEPHCRQQNAELVILPDHSAGRALAVKLTEKQQRAIFLGADVVNLTKDSVTVKKRVCGANLEWTKKLDFPAVITVGPADFERFAAIGMLRLKNVSQRTDWLKQRTLLESGSEKTLESASLVIVCGSGMGSKEACEKARQLAERLGAGFGLTRPAALNGWGATTEIVGHSGSIIAPQCCVVLGAAGAGAFAVGIEHSARILAVNTDPDALIFKNADIGLQMDARILTEQWLRML